MREYEFTYISRADLPEADRAGHFKKYEDLLLAGGGEILKKDEWGVKRLSYPIRKHFRGYYMLYDYVGTPESLGEVERLMKIDENILRFMAVRLGESIDIEARKAEIAKKAQAVVPANDSRH